MADRDAFPLLAVDVGNSRIKLGEFEHPLTGPLPHPARATALSLDWTDAQLAQFLTREPAAFTWSIASVNRPAAARLTAWLDERGVGRVRQLTHVDLPLVIELPRPDLVGVDRLANAVAVNRLRDQGKPAIVIDMGTAIKVDLVPATGAFAGGAILPGITMAARALHEFTDLLPLVDVGGPPPALGTATVSAMSSGLYWGAVGAVRELVARLTGVGQEVEIFLTGGAAPHFAPILGQEEGRPFRFVPHLTLSGIALAASRPAPTEI